MGCCKYFVVCAILVTTACNAEKLRLCATEDFNDSDCKDLGRGDSPLKCERVVDSAHCAIKLNEGKADFGIFTAEELFIAHHFYPIGLEVVGQLRNADQINDLFEFQSVVVVPKNYTSSVDGFGALHGAGFCHPGFSKSQKWNDHILKYFERKVLNKVCRNEVTVAENEIINLRDFFKKSCRPGEWVSDYKFDKDLKKKYPKMCELCDNKENCTYTRTDRHGHMGALNCLTSGRGQVAYAALHYVKDYFSSSQMAMKMSNYNFLCEDGTVVSLDPANPCTWYKQPWKVILAREDKANEIASKLIQASKSTYSMRPWEERLNDILFKKNRLFIYNNYTTPAHYLSKGSEVEIPSSLCGKEIRWCTVNSIETTKCNWTSVAALTLGINPAIACVEGSSTFDCFKKIANNEADFITIDSNYGYLARKVYGLSPIMFCETVDEKNSFVVAAIRESAQLRRITNIAKLKDSKACFPEYGGIAWLSFINVARDHGVLSNSCKYPQIVANLLQGACTPGFVEANHYRDHRKPEFNAENLHRLCDLCPAQENGERCQASLKNAYYDDEGALACLKHGAGDIAFFEARNIKALIDNGSINETDYRVLCKNGTLANYTGFDVDKNCALSVTIDSEIVAKRDRSDLHLQDMKLALSKMDEWLGYREQPRSIHIYDSFNDTKNVLFKEINGLLSTESDFEAVLAYKELFQHVDQCSKAGNIIVTVLLVIVNGIIARFL